MKVGILTYHRSINYGAFLQAYALSQRLKEIKGVEVEIIDYMSKRMDRYYKLFTIYRGKNGITRIFDRINMYRAFSNSYHKLPLSSEKLVSDDVRTFDKFIENKYDVIVVGSDAVWNYEKRGLPNPYFLINQKNCIKVSYAASCNGIKIDNLDKNKLRLLEQAFSDFQYLGVRDSLTEYVVKRATKSEKYIHNCDPTFLLDFEKDGLDKDFIDKLLGKLKRKYKWDANKKHIGLMLSNLNGNLGEILIQHLKGYFGNDYEIVSIYSYCEYADIPYISDLTPFEWSRIFSLFDITFSKYFHGTLLSIMNGTPVISLSAEIEAAGIPSKVEDVLSRLNLMEFYYPSKNASDIEWESLMVKVKTLIENPPITKMERSVMKESEYAESFFSNIKELKSRC